MDPRSDDGRVLFATPWRNRVIVGTTAPLVEDTPLESRPLAEEIDFLISHSARILTESPTRDDILSAFAGLRPLVNPGNKKDTAAMSRDHTIHITRSGLLTITGGKWTTYRKMAEDAIDHAVTLARLEERVCFLGTPYENENYKNNRENEKRF